MVSKVFVLDVLLKGERIGNLTLLPGDKTLLTFNAEYIENPRRPTLSLSFKSKFGELITDHRLVQTRLPQFFSNLLPEGPLREYLAKRAGINPKREFFLLWLLGQELPGAVTVTSADGQEWLSLTDEPPAQKQGNQNGSRLLRFSLAGVQLKFSALRNEGKKGGLTISADGTGGSWIVKLPSLHFKNVPQNEYAMMRLAGMVGIDVPEIKLVKLNEIDGLPEGLGLEEDLAFAVKRFDRSEQGAVHMEDFAQVFRLYPEEKYGRASYRNIAEVIWRETGEAGITEFVRRLVFGTLIGNADMHVKNWSLLYPNGIDAVLSPAYDFVSTIVYIQDETAALKYARTKRMDELTQDELIYFSNKAGLPFKLVIDTAADTVERFYEVWSREKDNLSLNNEAIDKINAHLQQLPLIQELRRT